METNAEQLLKIIQEGGSAVILEMIEEHRHETRFLDFKEKSDNDGSIHPSEPDKKNYAKALSGFANAEGGLLIWGVGEKKNDDGIKVASEDRFIKKVDAFVRKLSQLLPNAVASPIEGVFSFPVKKRKSDDGFAVTYIPKSFRAPHRSEFSKKKYYLRVGDNFIPMEHFQIEDLFGRRQRPVIGVEFVVEKTSSPDEPEDINYRLNIQLTNEGRSMATHFGIDFEFPGIAIEGYNGNLSTNLIIDRYYTRDTSIQLVKYRSANEQSPLFPGEKRTIIAPVDKSIGYSLHYHINDEIRRSDWPTRELDIVAYADNALPLKSKVNFDEFIKINPAIDSPDGPYRVRVYPME